MSVQTNKKQKTPAVTPRQTMRGHTSEIRGAVHLPGGQRIVTCAWDGSLRLWDLESGAQIGEDWRDEENKKARVLSMVLSSNGRTIVSGSTDGKVKLWDVEMGKVVEKWTGHTGYVWSVCWGADGKRVLSGSKDGTARVWDVNTGKPILTIETGIRNAGVCTAIYSPDHTQIVTGGYDEQKADEDQLTQIWDANTGKLLATLKRDPSFDLVWTSDEKKLICVGGEPIRIYDTTKWEEIAILEGHTDSVSAITLSQNDRLLVSASEDSTVRLWNLDTNLQVGPLIQHEDDVYCAALSADGKVLVTGCHDKNAYVWDIHAILKEAGHKDLLSIAHVPAQKSLKDGAPRRPPIQARRIPPGFFDDTQFSTAGGTHNLSPAHNTSSPRPSLSAIPRALLERLSSFFHPSHSNADRDTELRQRPRRSIFSHGPRIVEVATVPDRKALYVAPRPRPQQQMQVHGQGSSSQSQPTTTATSTTPTQGTSVNYNFLTEVTHMGPHNTTQQLQSLIAKQDSQLNRAKVII